MAKQELNDDQKIQHTAVLASAAHNLNLVIDQVESLNSDQYKKVSAALEDAYHELQTVSKKV